MVRGSAGIAFGAAVASLLRESRRRQRLTQSDVSARTGGVISKAALANYESGHRSVRVDVFWLLTRALDEDAGALLAGAERGSGLAGGDITGPVTIDVPRLLESFDERLAPVRRWASVRLPSGGGQPTVGTITLDQSALVALAALMGVDPIEAQGILVEVVAPHPAQAVAESAHLTPAPSLPHRQVTSRPPAE